MAWFPKLRLARLGSQDVLFLSSFGGTTERRIGSIKAGGARWVWALLLLVFLVPLAHDYLPRPFSRGGGTERGAARPLRFFSRRMTGEVIAYGEEEAPPSVRDPSVRAKAAITVLALNRDLEGVLLSMGRLEQRFNQKFKYPYVFLSDQEFSEEFRSRTKNATQAETQYGFIGPDQWGFPDWMNKTAAEEAFEEQARHGVLYGGRASYHHMCRYFSGFMAHHPLLAEFDYFWRMEPDVHYYCDLDYDPFLYMQENGIKYGFVITVAELPKTIPGLWAATQDFMRQNPQLVPADNLMSFVTGPQGEYNLCHFWSNFEVGDLAWFRSEAYGAYFRHLDALGGFHFERWGDAPVHTLAATMLLNASEVHHFRDIGYRHNSLNHCPASGRNKCDCDPMRSVDYHTPSFGACHAKWEEVLRR